MRVRLIPFAAAAAAWIGCDGFAADRLHVPSTAPLRAAIPGLRPLKLGASRDGLVYVPTSYVSVDPMPLVILLHGAGGYAGNWFGSYADRAESLHAVLLAPDSRGATWDAIEGGFGEDVRFINRALEAVAEEVRIDRDRMALAGFADGATYAISLALANGDLFGHVIAYSPRSFVGAARRGRAKYFVSGGSAERMLPLEQTSRSLAGILKGEGFGVEYAGFTGALEVPPSVSRRAIEWLAAEWAAQER